MFQIAKQRNKNGQDVQQVKVVKSECGEVLVEERKGTAKIEGVF